MDWEFPGRVKVVFLFNFARQAHTGHHTTFRASGMPVNVCFSVVPLAPYFGVLFCALNNAIILGGANKSHRDTGWQDINVI